MPSITSLGLGASALNQETIDKLRKADEAAMLKPIKDRVDKVIQQKEDFQTIVNSLKNLQTLGSYFSDELTYLKRSTSNSGNGGTVEAQSGVSPQSGKIFVEQLAQKSIYQSKGFAKTSDIISTKGGENLIISIDGKKYEIELSAGMTLNDLKEEINETTNGNIEASILNIGGDDPYTLVLKSKDTGKENEITITTTGDDTDFGFDEIQQAQDAKFDFNGVSITRDTNTVTDLMVGVTINLDKAGEYINFTISQDLNEMADKFEEFVNAYNDTATLLNNATKYDVDTGEVGSFQGESRINSIRGRITDFLFRTNSDGNALVNYGVSIDEKGILSFDKEEFISKMQEDTKAFEALLRGEKKITEASLITDKVGYEKIQEIKSDGSVQYSYTPLSKDVTVAYASIRINGIPLPEVSFSASNTPEENTQILVKAINKIADNTGVTASVSASGDKVVLSEPTGGRIEISEVSEDAKKYFGFSETVKTGSVEETDGIFSDLDDYFDSTLVGEFSTLGLLEGSLKSESSSLEDEIDAVTKRLDDKYAIMTEQFAKYNQIIKQFESDFNSLKMQIDTMIAAKK